MNGLSWKRFYLLLKLFAPIASSKYWTTSKRKVDWHLLIPTDGITNAALPIATTRISS